MSIFDVYYNILLQMMILLRKFANKRKNDDIGQFLYSKLLIPGIHKIIPFFIKITNHQK